MMQILSVTTSMDHAATSSFVGNVESSLQLQGPSHMPQFLQLSHTGIKQAEGSDSSSLAEQLM